MNFENRTEMANHFVDLAVARSMLTKIQAEDLLQNSRDRETAPKVLAMESGLLSPVQIDILEVMLDPTNVAPGFEVLDVVGHGGLGVVYRAKQTQLNRIVALKTIPISKMSGTGVVARFQQEAFAVGQLHHPNIVSAHDFGTHGERIYLAMELVEGEDLESRIFKSGPVNESVSWAITRQVAAGLAHAQELGIVHRDIKPANLLLTKPPAGYARSANVPLVKITDFGLAKLAVEQDVKTRLTVVGTALGTPYYMAPEQVSDNHVDHRADIYALGASVFHMLTGRPPYEGMTIGQIVVAKIKGDSTWLDELGPPCSPESKKLLQLMIAPAPEDRIQDYHALIAAIDRLPIRTNETQTAIWHSATPTPSETQAVTVDQIDIPAPDRKPRISRGTWGLSFVLICIIGFLYWFVTQSNKTRSLEPVPTLVTSGWQSPFFNGENLEGLKRKRKEWKRASDSEGASILQGSGSAIMPFPKPDTSEKTQITDYRILLGVDLLTADSVEVHFDRADESDDCQRTVLKVMHDRVDLGHKNRLEGELESIASTNFSKNIPTQSSDQETHYQSLAIERHRERWFAFFNDELVGSTPVKNPNSPRDIQLLVNGGSANFADLSLLELVPPESL